MKINEIGLETASGALVKRIFSRISRSSIWDGLEGLNPSISMIFFEIEKSKKLILIEGFRPSNPSQIEYLEILLKIRLTRAPEAFSKAVSSPKTCLVGEIRFEKS